MLEKIKQIAFKVNLFLCRYSYVVDFVVFTLNAIINKL